MSTLDAAQDLDRLGFNIVPANKDTKSPYLDWKLYQTERTSNKLKGWFSGSGEAKFNLCVVTGAISQLAIVDADSLPALEWLRELIGDDLDRAPHCRSPKAAALDNGIGHYYFALDPGQIVKGQSFHDKDRDFHWDLKAEGGITICPPSAGYEWVREPEPGQIPKLPEKLLTTIVKQRSEVEAATGGRSMLAHLLSNPGVVNGREVGRNDWYTRVMGHYAKEYRKRPDMYELETRRVLELANSIPSDHPFTNKEAEKAARSVWDSENLKPANLRECGEETGYLVAGDSQILAQVRVKDSDGNSELDFEPWADFDVRALGVVEDEQAHRTYDVEVMRKRQGDVRRALLPAKVMSDMRALLGWLAELGVGVMPPDGIYPRSGSTCERLRRYIEAQDPPHFEVVPHLGWHNGGFVCHEGVITEKGLEGFGRYKPDPKLINWAPHRYGFGDREEAIKVLSDLMTFHDPIVTAVFGSWWVATVLKPQIHEVTSQFPFMALEAPSESGKTTGFFPMMLQLGGNTQGQIDPTRASLRDFISAHQSGIVWIDDLSDTGFLMDLLRQATGEGSVSKKGEDRTSQEVVQLVAPICISGEALQLHHQKALMDRAVMLDVPSPTNRRSVRDPDRMQWLDIVEMRQRHPDLTRYSGTLVAEILRRRAMVNDIPNLIPNSPGRWGDKIAVVRMGARLLADLVSDPSIITRVEEWVDGQEFFGNENTLTMKLLPTALSRTGWVESKPRGPEGRWPATPVFIMNGTVWFNPKFLAEWWDELKHGRIETRVESEEALIQQARALNLGGTMGIGRKRIRLAGETGGALAVYWKLTDELSESVINRSKGDATPGVLIQRHATGPQSLQLFATTDPAMLDGGDRD